MNILLTGAFGNVGISALDELVMRKHRVRCFDLKTKPNQSAARQYGDKIEVVWGDIRNADEVTAAVRDQDLVAHAAFIIPRLSATGIRSEDRPDFAREVNVNGTRNLMSAMQTLPAPPRLIFTSSLHVYGRTQDLPPPRKASDLVQPVEHYAHHKVECEQMIMASDLDWIILRLGAALPVRLILDSGMFEVPLDNRIEYVHTRDVGLAIANAVESTAASKKLLLIGGGSRCQYCYRDLVERVLDAAGVGMLPAEAFTTTPFSVDWLDTSESQCLLHYQQRTLDDYLQDTRKALSYRLQWIKMFQPLVRQLLLRQSPYYQRAHKHSLN